MEERVYILNLKEVFEHRTTKRAARAIKEIRRQIKKFTKTEQVKISQALNNFVYARGFKKAPRKVKVKVIIEDNVAKTYLFDEEIKPKEEKKEKKEQKEQKQEKVKEEPKEQKEQKEKKEKEDKKKEKKRDKK